MNLPGGEFDPRSEDVDGAPLMVVVHGRHVTRVCEEELGADVVARVGGTQILAHAHAGVAHAAAGRAWQQAET